MSDDAVLNELHSYITDLSFEEDDDYESVIKFLDRRDVNLNDLEITELKGRNFVIINTLAECYYELKQYKKCILFEDKLIDFYFLNPDLKDKDFVLFFEMSIYTKGRCYEFLGRKIFAYKTYWDFIRINKESELIGNRLNILDIQFYNTYLIPLFFMAFGIHAFIFIIRNYFGYDIFNHTIMLINTVILLIIFGVGKKYNYKIINGFRKLFTATPHLNLK